MVQPLQPPLVDGELVPDPLLSHNVASAYNSDCSSDCRPSFQTFGDPRAPVAARHARSTVANPCSARSPRLFPFRTRWINGPSAKCQNTNIQKKRKRRKKKKKRTNPLPAAFPLVPPVIGLPLTRGKGQRGVGRGSPCNSREKTQDDRQTEHSRMEPPGNWAKLFIRCLDRRSGICNAVGPCIKTVPI